jgi:Protein of unknown function (DUF3313)
MMGNQLNLKKVSGDLENPATTLKASRSYAMICFDLCVCTTLLTGALLFTGTPSQAQDMSKKQNALLDSQSGFLPNYARLQPDAKNPDLLIYMKDANDFKNTSKFIIEPVEVYLLPEGDQRALMVEDLSKLAQTFTQAIKDELTAGGYQVVTEPGPGVMLLRIALTNVEPTGGKKNAALKGATTAASLTVAPGASLVVPRFSVGKVSIEGEIVDATTGTVEVDFMTSKAGKRYFSGLKQYQTWGDINAAFKSWAKNFRRRLNSLQA